MMSEPEKDSETYNREEIREDSQAFHASGTARSEKPPNAVSLETVNEKTSAGSRCGTGRDSGLAELSENSLDLFESDAAANENSPNLVSKESLYRIRCIESSCSANGKDDDLVDNIGTSSSPPEASEMVVVKKSLSLVTSDNVIELRSTENRCGAGSGLELGGKSLDLAASNAAGNENPSNSVSTETLHEIRPVDSRCFTGKDDNLQSYNESSLNSEASEIVIEVRCAGAECNAREDTVSKAKTDVAGGNQMAARKMRVDPSDPVTGNCMVLDVRGGDGGLDSEKVCRICHLNSERGMNAADLIQLGCDCKDELGIAHRHCAETWFKLKGNRWCEICGESAKNISGVGDNRFTEMWNDRIIAGIGSSSYSQRVRYWRCQPFGNFLLACLVIAFILPWFLRLNLF